MKKPFFKSDYGILLGLIVLIFVPPILVKSNMMNIYYISILIFVALNSMMAVGLNLLACHAGQISLGHAAFYGIGAYTSAILTAKLGCPVWLDVIAAMVLGGVIAWILGIPTLRLKGHYLAVATLGLGFIVYIVFNEWTALTEGPSGIVEIPRLSIFGTVIKTDMQVYYLFWAFTIIAVLISINLIRSRVGRALRALHSSEVAASSMGINVINYKIKIFVLSAMFASLAGSLYAHYMTFISPTSFSLNFSIMLVTMIIVGGSESIWGAILGAALLTILKAMLGEFLGDYKDYDVVMYGLILMVVVIFLPTGLVGGLQMIAGKIRGMRESDEKT